MTVSLSSCAIDNCAHNFGHVAIFVLTLLIKHCDIRRVMHAHLRYGFCCTMVDLLGKTRNGLVLLTGIFSVGHPTIQACDMYDGADKTAGISCLSQFFGHH